MAKNFNPFPSVRRDRQRQLDREQAEEGESPNRTPLVSPPRSPHVPIRPHLPPRTSTEQTIRSSELPSPISPQGVSSPNANESTTVRSSGLTSTDDEAFELYLAKQKELRAMRAAAEREAREMQSVSEAEAGIGSLGLRLDTDVQDAQGVDEEIELGHMQEIVQGLWIGDVVAARDGKALEEAGITAILTLLRQKLPPPPAGILTLPIPIDDTPDADILCHLDGCVRWIADVLESEQGDDAGGKRGAVLVHCQAGMSRSATVVAAYLMKTLNIPPEEALEMIREKRPVVYPSETFREQLALWYKAKFKASVKDREIRQWYMERTAAQVRNNGAFVEDARDRMAKYPVTPTASTPATPVGGSGKRKIRCKMCRRNLATRDHMMDHILDQSPMPTLRSRTPSLSSSTHTAQDDSTPASRGSRPPSFSHAVRPPALSMSNIASDKVDKAVPSPRRGESPSDPPVVKKAVTDPVITNGDAAKIGMPRRVLDPRALAASLPPQLAALRARVRPSSGPGLFAGSGGSSPTTPFLPQDVPSSTSSPAVSIASDTSSPRDSIDESALSTSPERSNPPARPASRRASVLAMTPTSPVSRSRSDSRNSFISPSRRGSTTSLTGISAANWPILVNPKCSGYFVEPLTWMEPMLASGTLAGKIVCPNEKCGAKIGSFDWAGVQCGCKEWVTPGFCIHRSKVDEVW